MLQLRKFENPKLVAELAARDAAAQQAQRASDAATLKPSNTAKPIARAKEGDEDSDGSGLFDDVGDDYEVDTRKVKEKQRGKLDQKVCCVCFHVFLPYWTVHASFLHD